LDASVSSCGLFLMMDLPKPNNRQHLERFNVIRQQYDPNGIFKSIVGEILGFYDN
jgi:hypothetical protein